MAAFDARTGRGVIRTRGARLFVCLFVAGGGRHKAIRGEEEGTIHIVE